MWRLSGASCSCDVFRALINSLICCLRVRCCNTDVVLIIIIIKVSIKRKLLSVETIRSAYTHVRMHTHSHTGTRIHEHSQYTKLNLHSLKRAANRLEMEEDSSTKQKTWQVCRFGKRNVFVRRCVHES